MLKKTFCLLGLVLLSGVSIVLAGTDNPTVKQATQIVWAGLDYSKVKMVGVGDFAQPDLFPGMLTEWNELFIEEIVKKMGNELHKTVTPDIDGVLARNRLATSAQIVVNDGKAGGVRWTPEQIASEVKTYKLSETSGVGLVVIVESMVKPQAFVDTVWFDIATREVLEVHGDFYKAGGSGFRNYWFSPVKRAIKKLN